MRVTGKLMGCGMLLALLAACQAPKSTETGPDMVDTWRAEQFGSGDAFGGLSLGGKKKGGGEDTGLGVNSYLWRASLDTVAFMPLASADPFGGVIITDWFAPAETPSERFKMNVFILDRTLRADGIKVAVFRQVRDGGGWIDQAVDTKTVTDVENAILTRARQLRSAMATAKQ